MFEYRTSIFIYRKLYFVGMLRFKISQITDCYRWDWSFQIILKICWTLNLSETINVYNFNLRYSYLWNDYFMCLVETITRSTIHLFETFWKLPVHKPYLIRLWVIFCFSYGKMERLCIMISFKLGRTSPIQIS